MWTFLDMTDATDFILSMQRACQCWAVVTALEDDVCVFACVRTRSLIKSVNFLPDNRRNFQAPPALLFSAAMKFDIHSVSLSLTATHHKMQGRQLGWCIGGERFANMFTLFLLLLTALPCLFLPLHSQSHSDSHKDIETLNFIWDIAVTAADCSPRTESRCKKTEQV